ncbi:MAG: HprK-related kinase A [Rudaea sp.]
MIAAAEASAARRNPILQELPLDEIRSALAGKGLWFDYGAATLRVRSDSAALASQIQSVYHSFPFVRDGSWADLHVDIERPTSVRRWLAPYVNFHSDGRRPFEPFPADSPLPFLEWGGNWLIGQRLNDLLLLHAGAVERDGLALLLPALPGSGKSTLTAALSLRGWRLLSDEFGAYDPETRVFRAMLKAVALKNESIGVIRRFAPDARLGPSFPKTRKGTVAHLGPLPDAVARRHECARPGAVILPRWVAGSPTRLKALPVDRVFTALAFNAFNYTTLGAAGFGGVVRLVRQCPAWTLTYSDLADAIGTIGRVWASVLEHHLETGVRGAEAWA